MDTVKIPFQVDLGLIFCLGQSPLQLRPFELDFLFPAIGKSDKRASARRSITRSCPMIGMPGKDAGRAVELLHQHRARHQMRPCRRTKREEKISGRTILGRMAVRRAERKARLAHTIIAPPAQ